MADNGAEDAPPSATRKMFGFFTQIADKVEQVGLIGPEVHKAATSGQIRDFAPMNMMGAALADSRARSQVRTAEDIAKQESARREQFHMPATSRPLRELHARRGTKADDSDAGNGDSVDAEEAEDEEEDEEPYWWERDGVMDEHRRRRRTVVGSVKISTLVGQGLCTAATRSPYLYISVEDTFKQTERLSGPTARALPPSDASSGSTNKDTSFWSWKLNDTENALTFPVTDVAADVGISLFAAKPIAPIIGSRRDVCIGKVIVPLVHLLEEAGPFKAGTRILDTWMTFYPLSVNELCFAPVIEGIPFSGMRRTSSSIGHIHVRIELTLFVSPVVGYLRNPPFRPVAAPVSDDLSPVLLRQGTNRLTNLAKNVSSMSFLLELAELREWESQERSLVVLIFVWYTCLHVPVWLMPCALSIAVVYLSWRTQKRALAFRSFNIWNDEVFLVLPDNVLQRLKLASTTVMRLQHMTNDAASTLERVCNSFNWTDPQVSALVSILTLTAGIGLSLSTLICSWVDSNLLSFRHLAFYTILACALPPALVEALGAQVNMIRERLGITNDDVADAAEESAATDDDTDVVDGGHNETGTLRSRWFAKVVLGCWRIWMKTKAHARNLFDRVPDEMEVAHRTIARRQRLVVNPALRSQSQLASS